MTTRSAPISTAVPVPDALPAAFGYEGEARYFGAYWLGGGDELMLADGRVEFTAANWHAWIVYQTHPAVETHLARYNFGGSDEEAEYWLIVDRAEHKALVASVAEARAFLRSQWPAPDVAPGASAESGAFVLLTDVELSEVLERAALAGWRQMRPVSLAEIRARLEAQAALCCKLRLELDVMWRILQ